MTDLSSIGRLLLVTALLVTFGAAHVRAQNPAGENASARSKVRAASGAVAGRDQAQRLADSVVRDAARLDPSFAPAGAATGMTTPGGDAYAGAGVAPAEAFALSTAADPQLDPAISILLARQASQDRGVDPDRFRVVRDLVETLTKASPTAHADELQAIYENAHRARNEGQLQENEQLGRLIHAAFARAGLTASPEYRRSVPYKRLLRRRIQLAANPAALLP